jgi:putative ABC transport system permease protein
MGRATTVGNLLAIDRVTLPAATWWRRDFADKPLGALMNALGANPASTLVSRSFLEDSGLQIGDRYTLSFEQKPVSFYVGEVVDYFPTLYPDKGPFFVANLEYVYDQVGITPYRTWARLEPGARSAAVIDAIKAGGVGILHIQDSRIKMNERRVDPQRTGLFGALTLGFVVALLLTVLGFFLYSSLSFQKRMVQLGVLRAMGLSVGQLLTVLFVEQVALIGLGVLFGTGLGLAANQLFIPFLQVGSEGQTPTFVVATAWTDLQRVYLALGGLLLAGLTSTGWLVRRMKLYQAVKLGEEAI